MKKQFFFCLFLFLFIIALSTDLIPSYRYGELPLNENITLGEFEITAHGNQFSIKEWWQQQPMVSLTYEGDESFLKEIKTVLMNLGFVIGEGKPLYINAERIQDRFLYLETRYDSKKVNNMDSLILFSENNISQQLQDFFQNAYGDQSTKLPKLILIHTERFFSVNGDILYKGPEYSIIKSFDEQLKITMDQNNFVLDIPFYPVLFLDLTQKQFLLTIETEDQQTVFIDGERFIAPIQVYLHEGVHEIEYGDHSQYIYLKTDMSLSLDDIKKTTLSINLNVPAQIILLKDGEIIGSEQSQYEQFELLPGDYTLKISKNDYSPYEESFQVSSSQQLKKDIVLIKTPGTVLNRIEVPQLYNDIFFEDERVILTNQEESLLIDTKNEMISDIDSKVVWFDGNIFVAGNYIKNWEMKTLYSEAGTIIKTVKIDQSLWLFTSDKKVISVDINTWEPRWNRTVNYTAHKIITAENFVGILDTYSRVILINTELGYREFFDVRIPEASGINFAEKSQERIRINLHNYDGYIDYYFKSKSTDLRKMDLDQLAAEFQQIDNMLYQNEKPLVSLSGKMIKVIKNKNHLAILTDEEMVVCTGY